MERASDSKPGLVPFHQKTALRTANGNTIHVSNPNAGSPEPIEGRCAAPLRGRPGKFCKALPLKGKTRCRMHGGKSLCGPSAPGFKHGEYSRYALLPPELAQRMEVARQDPDRLELTEHIDLLNARLSELMANAARAAITLHKMTPDGLAVGNPPWLELREIWETFCASASGTQIERQSRARIGALINAGAVEDQTWQQCVALIELARRLVETQTKRDKELGQFMSLDQAQMLFRQVAVAVHRHVKDPKTLSGLIHDLQQLRGGPSPTPTKTLRTA